MGFQAVSEEARYSTAIGGFNKKLGKPNPTQLEGYYLGTREVDSLKSKTGKANIHRFETKDGMVDVWGKTHMDNQIKSAKVGLMTRVVFSGMTQAKNGEMYTYKVLQDKSNVRPESESEDGGFQDVSEESLDSDLGADDFIDTPPPVQSAPPKAPAASPNKSRVEALLAARSSKAS